MLTYCTNIHAGESWREVRSNLDRHLIAVKRLVSPHRPFPIGLRLSARASAEIDHDLSERFRHWCQEHGCFVATINGFPYGPFHGDPVKEAVYLPDWRSPQRADYTSRLADLLAAWLPEGVRGSISTVPLGFREAVPHGEESGIRKQLVRCLEHLDAIAQRTGKQLVLSLEPEPGCVLETTSDVVGFFCEVDLPPHLRAHLGVCYDCCHLALQFEEPDESLALLEEHGVPIGHVQVSSVLRAERGELQGLAAFDEPVYLHQTVGRRADGTLVRFRDLSDALRADPAGVCEWRVHFHVPVFLDRMGGFRSTQNYLRAALPLFAKGICLEVETYTWSVLPTGLRRGPVSASIAREIQWVASHRQP